MPAIRDFLHQLEKIMIAAAGQPGDFHRSDDWSIKVPLVSLTKMRGSWISSMVHNIKFCLN